MRVALVFMDVRVELAVKFRGPALQRAETAGNTSEFSIAEGNLSQGDVLIWFMILSVSSVGRETM